MPTYTFRNKKTNEIYNIVLTYEEFLKYKKKRSIERIFSAPALTNLSSGAEGSFREWCRQPADNIDTSKSNNFRQSKEEYLYSNVKDK